MGAAAAVEGAEEVETAEGPAMAAEGGGVAGGAIGVSPGVSTNLAISGSSAFAAGGGAWIVNVSPHLQLAFFPDAEAGSL